MAMIFHQQTFAHTLYDETRKKRASMMKLELLEISF
jgi:hypothetical protein